MSLCPRTAFVLGAGLGTRLRPLTARRPKPLVPVQGRPLVCSAFQHLRAAGVQRFIVNTHHCAERWREFFPDDHYEDCPIHFRHEPVLLDTAGGIRNVADLLGDEPALVFNGDILTDLSLTPLIKAHRASGNLATLILRTDAPVRNVDFDPGTAQILDLRGALGVSGPVRCGFAGIYIVEPKLVQRIPVGQVLSIIPVLVDAIAAGERIGGVVVDQGEWRDLGTRDEYLAVHGATFVAESTVVEADVVLDRTVVWENARVRAGSRLRNCVVTDGAEVHGSWTDTDF